MSASKSDNISLPELTVVVLNWNGSADLSECLKSLKNCGYPALKILCVDNASTDNSVEMMQNDFPDIELIVTSYNLRWAGGNNFGLNHLGAELTDYVLLLNNDTIVKPGAFDKLVETAISKKAWAVTPRICYADAEYKVWYDGGLIGKLTGWIRHSGIRKHVRDCSAEVREIDYGSGCALLLSRECVQQVGLFDESFFLYAEDCDYSTRILSAGGSVWHNPGSMVLHKVSQSTGSDSPKKAYMKSRSNVHYLRKHCRTWTVWPFQVLISITQAGWFLFRGYPVTAAAVFYGFIDELRNASQKDYY